MYFFFFFSYIVVHVDLVVFFFYQLFDTKLCDLHEENFETEHWNVDIWGLYSIILYILYSVVLQKIGNSVVGSVAVCKQKIGFSDFQAI